MKVEGCLDDNKYYCQKSFHNTSNDESYVLKESLRQKCLFVHDIDEYLLYMFYFTDIMFNGNTEYLDGLDCLKDRELCSKALMDKYQLNTDTTIEFCINMANNSYPNPNNTVVKDVTAFKFFGVFRVPELRINNEIFKGVITSKTLFNAICSQLEDTDNPCHKITQSSSSDKLVFLIVSIVIICLLALITIWCYKKKRALRNVERLIDEEIQIQTNSSISQLKINKNDKLHTENLLN